MAPDLHIDQLPPTDRVPVSLFPASCTHRHDNREGTATTTATAPRRRPWSWRAGLPTAAVRGFIEDGDHGDFRQVLGEGRPMLWSPAAAVSEPTTCGKWRCRGRDRRQMQTARPRVDAGVVRASSGAVPSEGRPGGIFFNCIVLLCRVLALEHGKD